MVLAPGHAVVGAGAARGAATHGAAASARPSTRWATAAASGAAVAWPAVARPDARSKHRLPNWTLPAAAASAASPAVVDSRKSRAGSRRPPRCCSARAPRAARGRRGYHALVSRPTEPPTTIDAFVDGGVVCRARNMVRIHWGCPLPEQHGPDAPPARRPGPGAGTVPAGSPRAPGAGAAVCGENEAR